MNHRVKGFALITVVTVGAVCLVGGAVGGYLYGRFSGGGSGIGLGGEEGSALIAEEQQEVAENSTLPEDFQPITEDLTEEITEPITEPVTVPIIENLDTVEIIISGNGYLYRNTPVSLEALKGVLQTLQSDDYTIKITDKKAALKAYNELVALLDEMKMHYIEVSE